MKRDSLNCHGNLSDQTTLKYVLECGGSVVVFIGAAATSETGVGVAIAAGTGAVAIGVCI
jgi:hypothetical protein